MSARRGVTALACVLVAGAALAQTADDGEREALAARGPSPAMRSAVSARFAACYAAEGRTLSAAERAVLDEALASAAGLVAAGLDAGDCRAPEAEGACVAAAQSMSCDELARRLQSPGAATAAPSWALGYARALTDRVTTCYAAELDASTLEPDDRRALEALGDSVARAIAAPVADGRCTVDENQLPACALSVQRMSCVDLAARFGDDGAPRRALSEACARLLRCDDGDAGADPDIDF